MTTLPQWLAAQINVDERTAIVATPGPWTLYDRGVGWEINELPDVHDGTTFRREDAEFVAANDPQAVLDRVAAYRAVLAIHNTWAVVYGEEDEDGEDGEETDPRCIGCGFSSTEEPISEHVDDCTTLRALALTYRRRPGFQEEWTR